MKTMIQYLIDKYSRRISNLKWHLENNHVEANEKATILKQIDCYNEVVDDLKSIPQ